MSYLITKDVKDCFGCKVCEQTCPTGAIGMQIDGEGFWYPEIKKILCIECKKCETACPSYKENNLNVSAQTYAAWSRDSALRDKSSSGGVFSLIAEQVIKNNGTVVGAAFDEDLNVKHVLIDNTDELFKLQRSKYVQSDTSHIYIRTKELINTGKQVLFSGTPCQIKALYSYLGDRPNSLITCEIVCFGVPSPKIYRSYLSYLEEKYKSKALKINFKDKTYGWDNYTTKITFQNGKIYRQLLKDSFSQMMQARLSTRPSCDACNMHFGTDLADFTLGDFWEVGKYPVSNVPENGVSLVLVNSNKGEELFNRISSSLFFKKIESYKYSKKKIVINQNRTAFYDIFNTYGFKTAQKKCLRTSSIKKVTNYYYLFRLLIKKRVNNEEL